MAKNKTDEEGTGVEPLADKEEGSSRRGMLKRMGLATAALAALGLTSSKTPAQGRVTKGNPPSKDEILESLRKQGITNLDDLAGRISSGDGRSRTFGWAIYVKIKVLMWDIPNRAQSGNPQKSG